MGRIVLVMLLWMAWSPDLGRAASNAAQCRQGCSTSHRSCLTGAKTLFRTAAVECRAAVSKDQRRTCARNARSQRGEFTRACATAQQNCRQCCRTQATTGAVCNGAGSPAATSSICPNATGGLGAYWDWLNGVFHPLTQIPTAGGFWIPYSHPGYPLLGFRYPPEWAPSTLAAEQTIGVNLFRGDGAALWRYLGTWGDVSFGPRSPRDFEINTTLQYLGVAPSQVSTLCVNEEQAVLAPGITAAGSNIILQAGAFTIIVVSRTTSLEGLGGGQILVNTIFAPTQEFDALAFNVFLPIHFQLFVGKSSNDSDGDGIPDDQDNFPSDPGRR